MGGLAAAREPLPRPFRIAIQIERSQSRNSIVTTGCFPRKSNVIGKYTDSTAGVGPGGNASSPFGSR